MRLKKQNKTKKLSSITFLPSIITLLFPCLCSVFQSIQWRLSKPWFKSSFHQLFSRTAFKHPFLPFHWMTHKCDPHKPTDCLIKWTHVNSCLISLECSISLACLLYCGSLSPFFLFMTSRFSLQFFWTLFLKCLHLISFLWLSSHYWLFPESHYQTVPPQLLYEHTTHPLLIAWFHVLHVFL